MSKSRVNTEVTDRLKEMVLLVVRNLVNKPEAVEVNIRPGAYRVLVELYTDPEDVGQMIGRRGHLAVSLRSIVAAFAGKNRISVDFDYVTEEDNARSKGDRPRYTQPRAALGDNTR